MIRRDFRCPGPLDTDSRQARSLLGVSGIGGGKRDRDGALHPLLGEIERVQRAQRLSDCQFGLRCSGDPNLVTRIREGSWPRAATVAKIRAWILGQGCEA